MSLHSKVLALAAVLAAVAGDSSAQSPRLRAAMREKLANTQGLLEAVVTADYSAITRYTESLSRITETEVASWQAAAQPEYTQQAALFLLSVSGLREAAAARNIERVSLEYSTLISSCLRCHTYVRNSRRASLQPLESAHPLTRTARLR